MACFQLFNKKLKILSFGLAISLVVCGICSVNRNLKEINGSYFGDKLFFSNIDIRADELEEINNTSDNSGEDDSNSVKNEFVAEILNNPTYEFQEKEYWNSNSNTLSDEYKSELIQKLAKIETSAIETNDDKSDNGQYLASIKIKNPLSEVLTGWKLIFSKPGDEDIIFYEGKDNGFTLLPNEDSVYVDTRLATGIARDKISEYTLKECEFYILAEASSLIRVIYDVENKDILLSQKFRRRYTSSMEIDMFKGVDLKFYNEDGKYRADWVSPYSSPVITIAWYFVDSNNNTLTASIGRTLYNGQIQRDVFYEEHGRREAGKSLNFDFSTMKLYGFRLAIEYDPARSFYYDANLNLYQ